MRQRSTRIALIGATLAATASSGDAHALFSSSPRVEYADQAGSVSVSALSVAPWDDVKASLQPNFPMDEATALAGAIPTTQSLDERFVDLLAASLRVALPMAASSGSTTVSGTPGALTTQIDNTNTRSSGDVSNLPAASLISSNAAGLAGFPGEAAIPTGVDPILQHLAATALFQETHLLDQYVTNAVKFKGSYAFLVRLQLSVLPSRRNLPYDAVSDITIHTTDVEAHAGLKPAFAAEPKDESCAAGQFDRVSVVPLLVTDNLEGITTARSTQDVQQIGLALMGMISGIGIGGEFSKTREALKSTLGRDMNSVLTVARLTDDTVRVRLGAMQSPSHQYVMVPRTHDISLLVMYRPCSADSIPVKPTEKVLTAVTHTSFVDVKSGALLPAADYLRRWDIATRTLDRKYKIDLNPADTLKLYQLASQEDHDGFFSYIEDRFGKDGDACRKYGILSGECYAHSAGFQMVDTGIWSEILALRSEGEFSFTDIPIALRKRVPALPSLQTAVIQNDDKGATVTLPLAHDLYGKRIAATLETSFPRPAKKGDAVPQPIIVAATSGTVSGDGTSVSIAFPPLGPLKVDQQGAVSKLRVEALDDDNSAIGDSLYATQIVKKGTSANSQVAAFLISIPADYIVTDTTGHANVNVVIAANPATASTGQTMVASPLLTVSGAGVIAETAIRGTPISAASGGWTIGSPGEVRLSLENLMPGGTLSVTLTTTKGDTLGDPVKKVAIATPMTVAAK